MADLAGRIEALVTQLRVPPGSLAQLQPILARLGSEDMLDRAFDVAEYEAGTPFAAAGLELTALRVQHYDIDAYGFRVQGDRTLGYSGDSGPCGSLAELARDTDLFVCEATLERPELDGPQRGHLAPEEAEAAAAGTRRLLLTHRPHELPAPAAELAHDGLELEV
jgi:ribonuclease BN (tRNA processing enzyme)